MRRRLLLVATAGVLALSACERRDAPERPPSASQVERQRFRHRLESDVSGDYRTVTEPGAATWRVAGLFIGQESAFRAWESGSRAAAPLILTLEGPQGVMQITPDAYEASDESLRFSGAGPDGGEVSARAHIDLGALATARRNLGDQTSVVTGVVSIEGQAVPFSLGWWGGD